MDIKSDKAIGHFRVAWYVCLQKRSTCKHVHIKMSIADIFFFSFKDNWKEIGIRKWPTEDVSIWAGGGVDGWAWMGGRGVVNGEMWEA